MRAHRRGQRPVVVNKTSQAGGRRARTRSWPGCGRRARARRGAGACSHKAVATTEQKLAAIDELTERFPMRKWCCWRAAGDNMTITSHRTGRRFLFVIDVAQGDKSPRKGGRECCSATCSSETRPPRTTVHASPRGWSVRDAFGAGGLRVTNCMTGEGLDAVVSPISDARVRSRTARSRDTTIRPRPVCGRHCHARRDDPRHTRLPISRRVRRSRPRRGSGRGRQEGRVLERPCTVAGATRVTAVQQFPCRCSAIIRPAPDRHGVRVRQSTAEHCRATRRVDGTCAGRR